MLLPPALLVAVVAGCAPQIVQSGEADPIHRQAVPRDVSFLGADAPGDRTVDPRMIVLPTYTLGSGE